MCTMFLKEQCHNFQNLSFVFVFVQNTLTMMVVTTMTNLLACHRALLFVLNQGSPGQSSCEMHRKDLGVNLVTTMSH